jgi:hypothetical protein
VLCRNGAGLDYSAVTEIEARKVVSFGKRDKQPSKPSPSSPQDVIRAELTGDTCSIAAGITARGPSPVLALCRKLTEAGCDPRRPLHAYRGDTLCLVVRSIGEAARLEINGEGSGFRPLREPDAAPPMRQNGGGRPL